MSARIDLINRIDEQQFLLGFFRRYVGKKGTLVLHSPPGIGKSCLVDHVISQIPARFDYLTIGRGSKYDGATYIQQIAGALNDCATESGHFLTIPQFRSMLRSEDTELVIKLFGNAARSAGEGIAGKLTPGVIKGALTNMRGFISYFAAKDLAPEDIIRAGSNDAVVFCERYSRYVISENTIVLRINKYNEIDQVSDFYLGHIYNNSNSIILVLEITENDLLNDDPEWRIRIGERFSGDANHYTRIDGVDVKHVVNYYERVLGGSTFDVTDFTRSAFIDCRGDFRRFNFLLNDKLSRPHSGSLVSSDERLLALVKAMPGNCKRLLALVAAVPVRLEIGMAQEIWNDNPWPDETDLSSTLRTLQTCYGELLSIQEDALSIADDFIRSSLLSCGPLAIFHVAARKELLERLRKDNLGISSGDQFYLNLISIISLIVQGEGSGDSSLLISSLREIDLRQYPSNKADLAKHIKYLFYEYVYKSRRNADDSSSIREYNLVYEEICKILYRIGEIDLLERISSCYSEFLPIAEHSDALRLTLISAKILDGKKDSIRYIEEINKENAALYVGSRLLLILYYRTFDFPTKSKREWKRLRKEIRIDGSTFEGLYYEYGALAYPINIYKRIALLKKAKERYQVMANEFHLVSCSLGIANTYFYIPFFRRLKSKLAKEEFNSTSYLMPRVRIMDHIIENHGAVAEMHSGNWANNTLERLIYAYDRCTLLPDKLLIGANLINCFIGLRRMGVNTTGIEVYAKDILSISRIYQNRNSEFARYALAACYKYFSFMDDRPIVREMRERDLCYMSMQLAFLNFGPPRGPIAKLFVKYIYSKIYLVLWPKILPVYNWATDFYSIGLSVK